MSLLLFWGEINLWQFGISTQGRETGSRLQVILKPAVFDANSLTNVGDILSKKRFSLLVLCVCVRVCCLWGRRLVDALSTWWNPGSSLIQEAAVFDTWWKKWVTLDEKTKFPSGFCFSLFSVLPPIGSDLRFNKGSSPSASLWNQLQYLKDTRHPFKNSPLLDFVSGLTILISDFDCLRKIS